MSTTTGRIGLYKPAADGSENVNVVTDVNNNMDSLDAAIGLVPCTSSTRPAAPFVGQCIRETDTGKALTCTATGPAVWVELAIAGGVFGADLSVNGGVTASGAGVFCRTADSDVALTARQIADTQPALSVLADGSLNWGSGAASTDVKLYRSSAGLLTLNGGVTATGSIVAGDDLQCGDDLTVLGSAAISESLTVTQNATITGSLTVAGALATTGVGGVRYAYKAADETITNNSTMQDDNDLYMSVVANGVYHFELIGSYQAAAAAGLKIEWSAPAGTSMDVSRFLCKVATAVSYDVTNALGAVAGFTGTAAPVPIRLESTVFVGGTAGTVKFRWAQNTANASNALFFKGTVLRVTRLA